MSSVAIEYDDVKRRRMSVSLDLHVRSKALPFEEKITKLGTRATYKESFNCLKMHGFKACSKLV